MDERLIEAAKRKAEEDRRRELARLNEPALAALRRTCGGDEAVVSFCLELTARAESVMPAPSVPPVLFGDGSDAASASPTTRFELDAVHHWVAKKVQILVEAIRHSAMASQFVRRYQAKDPCSRLIHEFVLHAVSAEQQPSIDSCAAQFWNIANRAELDRRHIAAYFRELQTAWTEYSGERGRCKFEQVDSNQQDDKSAGMLEVIREAGARRRATFASEGQPEPDDGDGEDLYRDRSLRGIERRRRRASARGLPKDALEQILAVLEYLEAVEGEVVGPAELVSAGMPASTVRAHLGKLEGAVLSATGGSTLLEWPSAARFVVERWKPRRRRRPKGRS